MRTLLIVSAAMMSLAASVHAQWTATSLNPPGAERSRAYGGGPGRQAGYIEAGALYGVGTWSGTAGSWVAYEMTDRPVLAINSDGDQLVGIHILGTFVSARLWNGPNDFASLHPDPNFMRSEALGVHAGTQVGYVEMMRVTPTGNLSACKHASLWQGTAASWVDLHPGDPINHSKALGAHGSTQVGWCEGSLLGHHAAMWSGTAASWVDLHPAVSTGWSEALDASATSQVGWVSLTGNAENSRRAALWRGSAGSYVDLHPASATASTAVAVHGDIQVGWVKYGTTGNDYRAAVWFGSPDSVVILPRGVLPNYTQVQATGVWREGSTVYITGFGGSSILPNAALLWSANIPMCGTADFDGDGDIGTDADIESFFGCLSGTCCPRCFEGGADFNGDGDTGTDEDIESFFRVLAGGPC